MEQNKPKVDFEQLARINKQIFKEAASLVKEMGIDEAHELKRFAESFPELDELDGQKDSSNA